jgi:hypothetical protein
MAQQSIVGGLFGPTPAQIRARMREIEEAAVANAPTFSAQMGVQAGQNLGRLFGSLTGRDMTSPELHEAQQQGQMAQQAFQESGGDTRTGMLNVAQYYFSQGDYDKGAQAIKAAEALKPDAAESTSKIKEYEYAVDNGFQGTFEQWVASGVPSTKVEISGFGNEKWSTLNTQYRQDTDTSRTKLSEMSTLRTVLDTPGVAGKEQALQSAISELFGSDKVRAQAELAKWANIGDLGQRVTNSITKFFKGDYSQDIQNDMRVLLEFYEENVIESLQKENERYSDLLIRAGEDPSLVIRPAPPIVTFEGLDDKQLYELDYTQMTAPQRQRYEAELNRRLGQ